MNRADLDRLVSERAQVMRMLDNIPLERVIDRGGLEYRLDELGEAIEKAGDIPVPAKAVLTFNGKPVVGGSHGIYYDFATKALGAFADAVAKLAVPEDEGMGERGRIPNKSRLVITGTALGSFGFELEEAPSGELYTEEGTPTEQALDQITDILANTRGSNDDLARSISDAHPRALTSVREFLELLAKNDAIMGLSVKDRNFRFTHVAEVQESFDRLKLENVHEEEQLVRGRFLGVLPHRRTFEFIKEGRTEPIFGKVLKGVEGVAVINEHLNVTAEAMFKVTSVGDGRPSFVLLEIPKW